MWPTPKRQQLHAAWRGYCGHHCGGYNCAFGRGRRAAGERPPDAKPQASLSAKTLSKPQASLSAKTLSLSQPAPPAAPAAAHNAAHNPPAAHVPRATCHATAAACACITLDFLR
jgi:hypothetical protein